MSLLKALRSIFSPRSKGPTDQGLSEAARRTVHYCSLCSDSLAGHSVTTFASAIPSDPSRDRTAELIAAVDEKNWALASTILDFDGLQDEVVFEILRCPHSPYVGLLRVQSFTSLDLDDFVDRRTVLSEADSAQVLALARGPWIPL
jgi:hypothetical protein